MKYHVVIIVNIMLIISIVIYPVILLKCVCATNGLNMYNIYMYIRKTASLIVASFVVSHHFRRV